MEHAAKDVLCIHTAFEFTRIKQNEKHVTVPEAISCYHCEGFYYANKCKFVDGICHRRVMFQKFFTVASTYKIKVSYNSPCFWSFSTPITPSDNSYYSQLRVKGNPIHFLLSCKIKKSWIQELHFQLLENQVFTPCLERTMN